mgnify:CR=1 FL=1
MWSVALFVADSRGIEYLSCNLFECDKDNLFAQSVQTAESKISDYRGGDVLRVNRGSNRRRSHTRRGKDKF